MATKQEEKEIVSQCEYIFQRPPKKGEQCENPAYLAGDGFNYCSNCRKRAVVKSIISVGAIKTEVDETTIHGKLLILNSSYKYLKEIKEIITPGSKQHKLYIKDNLNKSSFRYKIKIMLLELHARYIKYCEKLEDMSSKIIKTFTFGLFMIFSSGENSILVREIFNLCKDPNADDIAKYQKLQREIIDEEMKLELEEEKINETRHKDGEESDEDYVSPLESKYKELRKKREILDNEFISKYPYYKSMDKLLNILLYGDLNTFSVSHFFILFDHVVNRDNFNLNDCFDFKIFLKILYTSYSKHTVILYEEDNLEKNKPKFFKFCDNLHKALIKCLTRSEDNWLNYAKEFIEENVSKTPKENCNKKLKDFNESFNKGKQIVGNLKKVFLDFNNAFETNNVKEITKLIANNFGPSCAEYEKFTKQLDLIVEVGTLASDLEVQKMKDKVNEEFFHVITDIINKAEFKNLLSLAPTGYVASFPGGSKVQEMARSGCYDDLEKKVLELTPQTNSKIIGDLALKLGVKLPEGDINKQIQTLREWLSQLK